MFSETKISAILDSSSEFNLVGGTQGFLRAVYKIFMMFCSLDFFVTVL